MNVGNVTDMDTKGEIRQRPKADSTALILPEGGASKASLNMNTEATKVVHNKSDVRLN
jgi:hypothetical protein